MTKITSFGQHLPPACYPVWVLEAADIVGKKEVNERTGKYFYKRQVYRAQDAQGLHGDFQGGWMYSWRIYLVGRLFVH